MKLLQSQKNQVYEAIENSGLNPSMFAFSESGDGEDDTYLRLNDSQYFFMFAEGNPGVHVSEYSPGAEAFIDQQYPGSWSNQLEYVSRWLEFLKRELNTPDKWKLLQEELENIDFEDIKYENTKFTYQEYEILVEKITELKTKISKLDLLEEQINKMNAKLDHLLRLAKDMNKTDWKNLFVGSIISLIMQLSIDRDTGKVIYGYVKNLFMKFLPSG